MKKILLYTAAALMALASCTARNGEEQAIKDSQSFAPGQPATIHASIGEEMTRTVVQSGGKVFWSPGEKIMVVHGGHNVQEVTKSCFTSTNTEPAASADFTGVMPSYSSAAWNSHPKFLVIYPYNDDDLYYWTNGTGARFVIPDEQTAVPGTFADNVYFAAAYTDDLTDIHFQHPLGGLVISVDEPGIEKIVLKANGGESIAGGVGVYFTLGYGYEPTTGKISIDETDKCLGDPSYGGINDGPSEITFAPASGTFIPGEDYYIVMRPTTLKQGFSLYVYKSDGRGTKLSIDKSVEIRRAEFRTLRECDGEFDWGNTSVTLDKSQIYLDCFSCGFYSRVICPGEYTVENDCDWITEIVPQEQWTQPFVESWAMNVPTPEHHGIGGDARFDGYYHVFAAKANYGDERTADIVFKHGGKSYTLKVTQAAGTYIPAITHRHFGYVLHSIAGGPGELSLIWDWTSEKWMMYYPLHKYDNMRYHNGRLEWCQGAYGQNGDDVFLSGQYLSWNKSVNDGGTWGSLDGMWDIYNWIHYKYGNDYPDWNTPAVEEVMDNMMDEIDEYYMPVTAIGVSACTAEKESRTINVTVDVYAAKAGTYTLTGILVEQQISFVPGGMLAAAYADNGIIGYFDDNYMGQSITFESDNMVKSVQMSIVAPAYSGEPENWQAGISYGGHGHWEDMWMLFITGRQYGGQVAFHMGSRPTDWYVDNCRQANFNTVYPLEVPGLDAGNVGSGIDPGFDPYSGEENWTEEQWAGNGGNDF